MIGFTWDGTKAQEVRDSARDLKEIEEQVSKTKHKQEAANRAGAGGPRSTHLESRVGHGKEKVGGKRRESDACNTSTIWNLVECQVCASTQEEDIDGGTVQPVQPEF